jgi:hypothetical protein
MSTTFETTTILVVLVEIQRIERLLSSASTTAATSLRRRCSSRHVSQNLTELCLEAKKQEYVLKSGSRNKDKQCELAV